MAKMIDQEKLDQIREQLREYDIDPDHLPEPESPEWDTMVHDLAGRNPALAQSFYSLVYDPEDQASAELIAEQSRKAMGQGGVRGRLAPWTRTKTVNGDVVPNTKLVRNILLGLGGAALLFVLLYNPSKTPKKPGDVANANGTSTAVVPTTSKSDSESSAIPAAPGTVDGHPKPVAAKTTPVKTDNTASSNPSGNDSYNTKTLSSDGNTSSSGTPSSSSDTIPSDTSIPSYNPYANTSSYGRTSGYGGATASGSTTGVRPVQAIPAGGSTVTPPQVTFHPATGSAQAVAQVPPALVSGGDASGQGGAGASGAGAVSHRVGLIQGGDAASTLGQGAGSTAAVNNRPALVQSGSGQDKSGSGTAANGTDRHVGLLTTSAQRAGNAQTQATDTAYGLHTTGAGGTGDRAGSQGQASGANTQYGLVSRDTAAQSAMTTQTSGTQTYSMMTRESVAENGATATVQGQKRYGLFSSAEASAAQAQSQPAQAVANAGNVANVAASTVSAPPKMPYTMGQQIRARLMTGAGVVEGANSQVHVFAQAEDGSIWRGLPTLDGRKRMQIVFDAVLKDGQQYGVSADAYSQNDNMAALPTKVTAAAPNAAYDLFNGLAKGAQTFAQAMLNQKTVTYQQGIAGSNLPGTTTTVQGGAPNFWLTTGAALLGSFAVPDSKSSLVMVAQLPAGTNLNIVVSGTDSAK